MTGPESDLGESGTDIEDTAEERVFRLAAHMRALSGLFHGLVHDLKSPINSLVVNLELLKASISESPDIERQKRYVRILDEELVRLNRSVERLLPAAGPPQEDLGRFDLRDLVEQASELLSTTARHQSVKYQLDLPEDGKMVPVHGYRDHVKQALLALAVNALEAMPRGGRLEVRLSADAGEAVLTVTDTGGGIPAEVADRLFEPYVTTKDRHEGIGLYVARSVVESTNGSIRHETVPDGGSRFTLTLPLAS